MGAASELPAAQDTGQITGAGSRSSTEQRLLGKFPFSGADIKLIVHLPPESVEDQGNEELRQLEEELSGVQRELDRVSASTEGTTIRENISAVQATRDTQLAEVERISAEGGDSPTPDQIVDLAVAQEELATSNARITELTSQYNAANAGSVLWADLEHRATTLASQIEAARESGNSGEVRTKILAEISTFSWSIHREKFPVRPLGTTYVRSYCRGPRSIAGSIVFATFNKHIFYDLFETAAYRSTGVGDWDRFRYTSFLADQLPPMDISVVFANEYGNFSWMALLGVELVNEGGTMSIEDLFVEGTCQYVARDIDVMRDVGQRSIRANTGVGQDLTGTSILNTDYIRRARARNIPWI